MSQENVEIVQRIYAYYQGDFVSYRGDPSDLLALFDPDIEWHPLTGALLEGVSYRGHEGIRQWLEDVAEYWESMTADAERFVDSGETVVALGRIQGRGRASGVEIETPAAWVWQIRNGRATYMQVYFDHSEGLEAAGLSE
jgi:ketosteroid isomerase-like protein